MKAEKFPFPAPHEVHIKVNGIRIIRRLRRTIVELHHERGLLY